ncbi:MAG: hypothetical protein O7D95_02975 [Betaproteobacteria bacterium]|nr:hypothetical protein [Betaproteobacteria bacterium]
MNKQIALDIFGSQAALGRAVGRHRATIWHWSDELTQSQADEVVGAAIRLRKAIELPNAIIFYKAVPE